MASLFNPYDILPFLQRQSVPYQAPRAPDISGLSSAIGDIGGILMKKKQQAQQDEHFKAEQERLERQRLQQAALEASGQGVQMRGQDLLEQGRKDTNERLDRDKAETFIRQALSSGNMGDVHALDLAAKGLGWTREEVPSDYQAPTPAQAPPGPQAATTQAPPGLSFDQAFDSMVQKESGGNPRAVNPKSGALGLYQLMQDQLPPGVSKDQFLAMTADQQKKDFTDRYLPSHGLSRDTISPNDVGLATGAPAAIGKPDDFVVYPKGSAASRDNPTWDRNKDGQVTAGELRQNYVGGGGQPPMLTLPEQRIESTVSPDVIPFVKPGALDAAGPPTPKLDLGGYMQDAYGVSPLGPSGPQSQGGKHIFRDKQGNVVAEIDLPNILARHSDALSAALDPILSGAKTPAEKQAAEQAKGFATKAVQSGEYSWKDAANKAIDFYKSAVGEAGKTARAGVGSDFRQLHAANQQADHILGQVARDYKLPTMALAERDMQDSLEALNSDTGTGDVIGVRKLLHAIEGRATDADYTSLVNSSGWLNTFMNLTDKALRGRITPEVMQDIKGRVQAQLQNISRQKAEAAQRSADLMEQSIPYVSDDLMRQLSQRNYNYFYGGQGGVKVAPDGGLSDDDLIKGMP